MAIKRIPIGGIYKDPSGQIADDGMCAESLNVQIEQGEIAPMLAPEEVTEYYRQTDTYIEGIPMYIHKGNGYNNLIFFDKAVAPGDEDIIGAYTPGNGEGKTELYTLQEGEEIKDIASIGNTIIIATNQRIEYVLWNGGDYKDLGDRIPIPKVEFQCQGFYTTTEDNVTPWYAPGHDGDGDIIPGYVDVGTCRRDIDSEGNPLLRMDYDKWKNYLAGKSPEYPFFEEQYIEVNNLIWGLISEQTKAMKLQGYFPCPVFARFSLKLYDGSYIYQSVPVLLGADIPNTIDSRGEFFGGTRGTTSIMAILAHVYKVKAYLRNEANEYNEWKDIVSSIDIFLSEDLHFPEFNTKIEDVSNPQTLPGGGHSLELNYTDSLSYKKQLDTVLSKSTFYRIATFNREDLSDLRNGFDLMSDDSYATQDYLVTQPKLEDGFRNLHKMFADSIDTYNNRLIEYGLTYEIATGYHFLNGANTYPLSSVGVAKRGYIFRYHIRGPQGQELVVLSRNAYGTPEGYDSDKRIYPYTADYGSFTSEAKPFAWISYPDSRCYRVDVQIKVYYAGGSSTYYYKSFDMRPHPNLECAYCFLGMGQELAFITGDAPSDWSEINESREYSEDNTFWASKVDNPFLFLPGGKQTFTGKIIGTANTTKALSEGQFGQFPMYVFTDDGVWVLPIDDEGSFRNRIPLSRDIAVSKDSIAPIEQAIVFVTKQGVMLLQGSSVTPLSKYMNGPNLFIPGEIATILSNDNLLAPVVAAHQDATRFDEFIQGCKIAYDYVGSRLIFLRPDETYQYVYRLDSQSWHKMCVDGIGIVPAGKLNSYPNCFVSVTLPDLGAGKYALYNFSVTPSSSSQKPTLPGLIYLRDISLDEANIYKTLHRMKVRGRFNYLNAKWAILGSNDGMTYYVLHSLHGPSWKWYRIILTSKLTEKERMSYLELEYTQKFLNKLR